VDFRAVDFFAVERFAVDFLAVDLRAVDRFAVALFAVDFLAVRFAAVFFLAADFLAVDFFAGDRFAVAFLAVDFLAVAFFAVRFAAVFLFAVAFFAVDFFAVDLRAAVFFFAPDDLVLERDEERVRAGIVRGVSSCCSSCPDSSGPPIDHSAGEAACGDSLAGPNPLQSSWVIYDLPGSDCVHDSLPLVFLTCNADSITLTARC